MHKRRNLARLSGKAAEYFQIGAVRMLNEHYSIANIACCDVT